MEQKLGLLKGKISITNNKIQAPENIPMKKDLIQLVRNMALESLEKDLAILRQLQDPDNMIPQILT